MITAFIKWLYSGIGKMLTKLKLRNQPIDSYPQDEIYIGDAYCVKCKEKRNFEGGIKVADSGRRMAYGVCPECGTKMNRILDKEI